MTYDELHQRYGSHITKRLQVELSASEFRQVTISELPVYLEMRAEAAHKEYQARLDNPYINEELGQARGDYVKTLYLRWRTAEDLAYLISIAEDVNSNAQLVLAVGQ